MANVVWTPGANSLTFDQGVRAGSQPDFDFSGVVTDRLADGSIVSYNLGVSDLRTIHYVFPHLTQAKLDALLDWKDTKAIKSAKTFTHADYSKSPAWTATVRLVSCAVTEAVYTDPAQPRYSAAVSVQVEPS